MNDRLRRDIQMRRWHDAPWTKDQDLAEAVQKSKAPGVEADCFLYFLVCVLIMAFILAALMGKSAIDRLGKEVGVDPWKEK